MQDVKTHLSLTTLISSKDTLSKSVQNVEISQKVDEDQKVSSALEEFSQLLVEAEEKLNITAGTDQQTSPDLLGHVSGLNAGGNNLQASGKEFPLNASKESALSDEILLASIDSEKIEALPIIPETELSADSHDKKQGLGVYSVFEASAEALQSKKSETPAVYTDRSQVYGGIGNEQIKTEYFDLKNNINQRVKEETSNFYIQRQSLFSAGVPEHQVGGQPIVNSGLHANPSNDLSQTYMQKMSDLPYGASAESFHTFSATQATRENPYTDIRAVLNSVTQAGLVQSAENMEVDKAINHVSIATSHSDAKIALPQNTVVGTPVTRLDTPFGQPGWGNEFVLRINGLAVSASGERTANIQLRPAELGSVEVRLVTEGDSAKVHFVVQNHMAREAIESALPRLRDSFEQVGLSLDSTDVSSQSHQNEPSDQQNQDASLPSFAGTHSDSSDLVEKSQAMENDRGEKTILGKLGPSAEVDLYI